MLDAVGNVLDSIWNFLKDESNRAVLNFVGTPIAAIAAAVWAVVTFFTRKGEKGNSTPTIKADRGSIAGGGKVSNNRITYSTGETPKE